MWPRPQTAPQRPKPTQHRHTDNFAMLKPWGIGAWAAEAEREEAEEMERAAAAVASAPLEAFPTLGVAVTSKPKKKKQQQTFSLAELTIGKSVAPGSRSRVISDSHGLTAEEMMMLPTGPRDRSSEEEQSGGLGGAFKDYNRGDQNRGGFDGGFTRERWGEGFLHDRERDRDEPSRADDSSNWSSLKKPMLSGGFNGERRGRQVSGADREPPPPSRADKVDNWGLGKKSLPLGGRDESKQHSRTDEADNWGSTKRTLPLPPEHVIAAPAHDATHAHSRADEADNWTSSKKIQVTEQRLTGQDPHMQGLGEDLEGRWGRKTDLYPREVPEEPQRRLLVIAPRTRPSSPPPSVANDSVNATEPNFLDNPYGSARPREDLVFSRGLDFQEPKNQLSSSKQDSRPSSSHYRKPETPEVPAQGTVSRPKVNPFGDAKPREVLLQERGKDWRKMDFEYEHRGVDRPETEEETLLKLEIEALKVLSNKQKEAIGVNGVLAEVGVDSQYSNPRLLTADQLRIKEKQLEDLIRALDDKIRFFQKVGERPSSHSGRSHDASERPGSRPGSRPVSRSGRSDAGRSYDSWERPGSQSGRRNFDLAESPYSHWGYTGREPVERWSQRGQFEVNGRNPGPLERMDSWTGSSESGRSFGSLQGGRRRSINVATSAVYPQEVESADVWTRSYELGHNSRRGSWEGRDRVNERRGMRW